MTQCEICTELQHGLNYHRFQISARDIAQTDILCLGQPGWSCYGSAC